MENTDAKLPENSLTEETIAESLNNYLSDLKAGKNPLNNPTFGKLTSLPLPMSMPNQPITQQQFENEISNAVMKHNDRLINHRFGGNDEPQISAEELKTQLKENGLEDISDKIFKVREKLTPESTTANKPKKD
jgi:hypothetical protein